jgi:CelD/BcsL family acetyltransferase involved in cellulose biosynthesis
LLAGLVETSALFGALVSELKGRYRLGVGVVPPTRRFRASLAGGVDGFLSRRSPTFRAGLRQAARKAAAAGVSFEPVVLGNEADAANLYARLLAVESRSWKGLAGDGLTLPEMRAFYAEMLPRLARTGAIRAHVGVRDGRDVAMIVGGVVDTPRGLVYRGLQFSFDDAYRSLSLGNLAQLAQITALAAEGAALYDLGSEVEYKRRWGELCLETVTLVAMPRG